MSTVGKNEVERLRDLVTLLRAPVEAKRVIGKHGDGIASCERCQIAAALEGLLDEHTIENAR